MPQISISLTEVNGSPSDNTLTYDLSLDLTIRDLKSFVEAETGYSPSLQTFWFNGQPLANELQTLEQAQVKDGDMLALLIAPQAQKAPRAGGSTQTSNPEQPSTSDVEILRQRLLSDRSFRDQVARDYPDIAAAANNQARFRELYMNLVQQSLQRRVQAQAEMERLNEDPFNPENQEKIAEMIRKENVERELSETMETNPEFFARVTMLYVNVQVNGHPVKAFVDSGAQATIMSPSCAEACNITRLIDERYAGIARGVGTARILGRVHRANVKIGDAELPCAFTVMEGKDVDMLLGLDMLRRYQACIDLAQNKLIFSGGVAVPFLPESEIPKYAEEALANEPTVAGPDGNEIGAVSGAIRPASAAQAGSSASASAAPSGSGGNFRGPGRSLASSAPSTQGPGAATPPAAAGATFPQASIDQLQSLGYSREEVIAALQACDGNVEYAASLLFDR